MTFDTNREGLASLYTDQSLMTYEGTQIMGQAAIMNKYRSLGFNQAKHNIKTQDAHPNPLQPNAVIVFVTGDLQIEGQEYPMKFAEVFHLVQTGGMCRPVMSFTFFVFVFWGYKDQLTTQTNTHTTILTFSHIKLLSSSRTTSSVLTLVERNHHRSLAHFFSKEKWSLLRPTIYVQSSTQTNTHTLTTCCYCCCCCCRIPRTRPVKMCSKKSVVFFYKMK